MIGLVNTPEEQRVKLIRNESIGIYSWDSSDKNVNSYYGVNEWSQADVMTLLNMYYYNSFDNQLCTVDENNQTVPCGFLKNGLKYVHSFIDYNVWNLGSNGESISWNTITTTQVYNIERSNFTGDWCKSKNDNAGWCNDKVSRNIIWTGNVALMYPSDYGYATSGDILFNREQCLNDNLFKWSSSCYNHNWLNKKLSSWTMTSAGNSTMAEVAYHVDDIGSFNDTRSHTSVKYNIFPTFYLKSDILVSTNSNGSIDSPYIIG